MDDDLVERIAKAFARHPWVARVLAVTKRHPASVKVELAYRKPVCMVVVPGGLVPVDDGGSSCPRGEQLFAARSHAVSSFGGRRSHAGCARRQPLDRRKVIGGAEIAAAIGPAWQTFGLRLIVPLAADPPIAAGAVPILRAGNAANRSGGGTVLLLVDPSRRHGNSLGLRPLCARGSASFPPRKRSPDSCVILPTTTDA